MTFPTAIWALLIAAIVVSSIGFKIMFGLFPSDMAFLLQPKAL